MRVVFIACSEAFCHLVSSWRWCCRWPKALATPGGVSVGSNIVLGVE